MSSETVLPETTPAEAAGPAGSPARKGRDGRIVVVFVIDNMRLGGTELNAVRTAERLDRSRFELRVVCLSEDGPLTERYAAIGVPVVNLHLRGFYGRSMMVSGMRFRRLLAEWRTDIVHAHDVYSNIFAAVWSPVTRKPAVITSQRWNSFPNRKLEFASRFYVWRSSAVLANSQAVAELIADESPKAKGKVWTITNFADEEAFGRAEDEEQLRLRQSWNAPDRAVIIGCVARLNPLKDHATLLRAFAQLHSRYADTYLVLIGDGECRRSLETLARELKVSHAVHFAGEVRGSHNLHRGFDISVLASTSEGFPNTLVEAMAAGVPIVATAVGGSVDAVVHERTGLLVPPAAPEEMAQALLRLASNAGIRAAFGQAGEQRARERFRTASTMESLSQMYVRLVDGSLR